MLKLKYLLYILHIYYIHCISCINIYSISIIALILRVPINNVLFFKFNKTMPSSDNNFTYYNITYILFFNL